MSRGLSRYLKDSRKYDIYVYHRWTGWVTVSVCLGNEQGMYHTIAKRKKILTQR